MPSSIKVAAVVIVVIFGVNTVLRNRDWKNLDKPLRADLPKYPNSAFLNYKLGLNVIQAVEQKRPRIETAVQQRDVFLKAKTLIEKSVLIDPGYVPSRSYLCYINIYLLNDFKAALPHIDTALRKAKNTELYFYKAICMRETKQPDSAEFYLKKCFALDIKYFNAYNLLSFDYNAAKQYQKNHCSL